MVSACMEIETTRDIARQILRHRSFSFQEFSQRYADPTKGLNFQIREARLQDTKNRQNSIEMRGLTLTEQNIIDQWRWKQEEVIRVADDTYQWAIEKATKKSTRGSKTNKSSTSPRTNRKKNGTSKKDSPV